MKRISNTKSIHTSQNYEVKYQDEYLEAEEDINEDKLTYLEEDMHNNGYSTVTKEQDEPVQE